MFKLFVVESIAKLIVRVHFIVVDLFDPNIQVSLIELFLVEIMHIMGFSCTIESASHVDQHLAFFLAKQTHFSWIVEQI